MGIATDLLRSSENHTEQQGSIGVGQISDCEFLRQVSTPFNYDRNKEDVEIIPFRLICKIAKSDY